jgi:hypothetical protein
MSNFGTGEMFVCFVIGGLVATAIYGWPILISLVLFVIGYSWFMNALNETYYPDGSPRPRGRRRSRRR